MNIIYGGYKKGLDNKKESLGTYVEGWPLGAMQCYGFAATFYGFGHNVPINATEIAPRAQISNGRVPDFPNTGVYLQNILLGSTKSDAGHLFAAPGSPDEYGEPGKFVVPFGEVVGSRAIFRPENGIYAYLVGQKKSTGSPGFGALAFFENKSGIIAHAAIVLGHSKGGDVYVLQKLNEFAPICITTTKSPVLESFKRALYFK